MSIMWDSKSIIIVGSSLLRLNGYIYLFKLDIWHKKRRVNWHTSFFVKFVLQKLILSTYPLKLLPIH
ncbi:hypothetical protein FB550_11186 [Neobacillus bataviensis]|uniref:Uncharacterized protein n=1 Tax=Neobacillus bataviensis TaxID=220685 RepID=A0A561CZQ0_9BACI|nr:hypothetical protein FB550_11186 [Neobacillus bataviensis]